MIKAIVFDLWKTLGVKQTSLSATFRKAVKLPKKEWEESKYEKAIQLKKWKTKKAMANHLLKAFNKPVTEKNIKSIVEGLNKSLRCSRIRVKMKKRLIKLKKNYKLGILSNTTSWSSESIKRWGINNLIDAQSYSWQTKSLKPSKKSFMSICKKLKVKPKEALFVDDSEKNIKAAKKLGIITLHYHSFPQFNKKINNILDN